MCGVEGAGELWRTPTLRPGPASFQQRPGHRGLRFCSSWRQLSRGAGRRPAASAPAWHSFTSCSPLENTTASHNSRPTASSFFLFYTLSCFSFLPFLFLPCTKRGEEACVYGWWGQAGGHLLMPSPSTPCFH